MGKYTNTLLTKLSSSYSTSNVKIKFDFGLKIFDVIRDIASVEAILKILLRASIP